jgi:hypothetical protein
MKKTISAVAAILLIATSVVFATSHTTKKANDCCVKHSSCCAPGKACCAKK